MKRPQDDFLLFGARWCERVPVLSRMVAGFHLCFVIPMLQKWCALRFGDAFTIVPRHSLLTDTFNPFLSDIDMTLVFRKGGENVMDEAVDFFLRLHRRFPVFDLPQVYLEDEWTALGKTSGESRELDFFWNFRKLSWLAVPEGATEYERFKKDRAVEILRKKVFRDGAVRCPTLNDLRIDLEDHGDKTVCVWSPYLELVTGAKVLLCSPAGLDLLSSLLPGLPVSARLNEQQKKIKRALWLHEYLLSRSDLRISSRTGKECSKGIGFIRWLEDEHVRHYSQELIMNGPEADFLGRVA